MSKVNPPITSVRSIILKNDNIIDRITRSITMLIAPKPYTYDEFPEASHSPSGMKTVEIERVPIRIYNENVVYARRGERELRLQIFVPFFRGKYGRALPLVVYVQGSSWRKQELFLNLPQLSDFSRRGYVLAIVEYRESDCAAYPAQVEDVKDAVRFLKKNAGKYRVDKNKVIMWGDSSGGHIALCTAFSDEAFPVPSASEQDTDVNVLIDYYGPTDIGRMNEVPCTWDHITEESPGGRLIGGLNVLENPDKVYPAVPMNHLSPDKFAPPVLIMHGDKDRIVPFQQSALLYEALVKNGKTCEFVKVKGADHGSSEFWSDSAYDIIEEFIHRHI
jgi:acetyl esterase/lipase